MDQVRMILGWLKRQHFWVLCGVVALIALFCWWSASRKLSAMYDTNQKTITAQFGSLKQVRDATFHANAAIIERQKAEKKKQTESVAKLWQQLYDKQRDQVLQWPAALSQAFRDAVDKMQFADEIPAELRNHYQNYIERHFPELPKKINARILEASAAGGPGGGEFARMPTYSEGPGGVGGMPDEGDYICEWLDQGVIREELNFPERPSSLRIWVTQEDLWVYHTLLDVIAKTNQAANATRMANAAVKIVYSLEVGARAAQYSRQPGRLLVQPAAAAAGVPGMEGAPGGVGPEGGPMGAEPGGPGGGRPMMMDGMMGGGGMNNTQMSPAQEQNALLSWRYLDDKGAPISVGAPAAGGEMPSPDGGVPAADTGSAPPVDLSLFGPGYKRLPIRMVLRMDARYLPQLITTCANQPLRVEVQEVRINSPDIAGLDANAGGMMGGMGGGMRNFEGGGFGGAGGTSSLFADHSGIQNFPSQPNVVNVVIQGTIYVFNKPNLKLLEEPPAVSEAPLASQ